MIELLDAERRPSGDSSRSSREIFARVLLENAHDTLTAIVFVHGVTSVAALGNLLPHIDARDRARAALPYAWQAACGLYATFGRATTRRGGGPASADCDAPGARRRAPSLTATSTRSS